MINSVVAVVGFEQLNYTVIESVGFQEVCVQVLNPPSNEKLVSSIFLVRQTRAGSAGIIFIPHFVMEVIVLISSIFPQFLIFKFLPPLYLRQE